MVSSGEGLSYSSLLHLFWISSSSPHHLFIISSSSPAAWLSNDVKIGFKLFLNIELWSFLCHLFFILCSSLLLLLFPSLHFLPSNLYISYLFIYLFIIYFIYLFILLFILFIYFILYLFIYLFHVRMEREWYSISSCGASPSL